MTSKWLRVLRMPGVLLVIGLVLMSLATAVAVWAMGFVDGLIGSPPNDPGLIPGAIVYDLVLVAAYWLLVRKVEGRPFTDFAPRGAAAELGSGILLGAVLMSATIGIMALIGMYRVTGTESAAVLIPMLALSLTSGVGEEILLRGVIFRLVERGLGSWIALLISALLFGAAHLGNPNAGLFPALAIAVEAGILLAAIYMVTRRLWAAIGLHAGWNFFQGGIWGVPVSGIDTKGVLVSERSGPELLTGGAFGAEASIVAVALATATGIALLVIAHRRGQFVQPFWVRRRQEREAQPPSV